MMWLLLSFLSLASPTNKKCETLYSQLYKNKTINMRMIFGYKDSRPTRFVGDRHERMMFLRAILASCESGEQACGFGRDPNNMNLFIKRVRDTEFRLSVFNSSVSSDDQLNRQDPFQLWQTYQAESEFLNGLSDADIVFYNGHSRAGGGPDFGPPILTKAETVDYTYYGQNTPGLTKLLDRLNKTKKENVFSAKVLGLFSCASNQHFKEQVFATNPKLMLLTSKQLVYYTDAIKNSIGALETLMSRRCDKLLGMSI